MIFLEMEGIKVIGCVFLQKVAKVVSDPTTMGIIIGSLFTLAGVFLQGVVAYFLEGRKNRLAIKTEKLRYEFSKDEQNRKERISYARELQQKREKAYLDFVNFYNRILIGLATLAKGKESIDFPIVEFPNGKKDLGVDNANGQLGFLLGQTSDINTAIRLYGSKDICDKASAFIVPFLQMESSGTITYDKILSLSNILDAIIYAMNEENHLFEPSHCGCLKVENNHT